MGCNRFLWGHLAKNHTFKLLKNWYRRRQYQENSEQHVKTEKFIDVLFIFLPDLASIRRSRILRQLKDK